MLALSFGRFPCRKRGSAVASLLDEPRHDFAAGGWADGPLLPARPFAWSSSSDESPPWAAKDVFRERDDAQNEENYQEQPEQAHAAHHCSHVVHHCHGR